MNKQKEKYYYEYVPDLLDVRGPIPSFSRVSFPSLMRKLEPSRFVRDSCEPIELIMVIRRKTGDSCVKPER